MLRRRAGGFHPASLDAVNFLLADVRGALGPYLNVFLVSDRNWNLASVGLVTTVGGLLGLIVQTPVGAAIDATRHKRGLITGALAVLGLGAVVIFALPRFWPVMLANALMATVSDVFAPAVAALTWGLYRRGELTCRLGRNAAFDHAGNMAIAALAGLVGWAISQRAVFLLAPALSGLAGFAVLSIPAGAIDHARARGGRREDEDAEEGPRAGIAVLWSCCPLVVFAGCVALFHFANAPLLPLVGQKLAAAHQAYATAMMSACIIAAQGIMLPLSVLVGHAPTAEAGGRCCWPPSWSCRSAPRSTSPRTTRRGRSACNCWMASEPASCRPSCRSSSLTSCAAPGAIILPRMRWRPPRASARP